MTSSQGRTSKDQLYTQHPQMAKAHALGEDLGAPLPALGLREAFALTSHRVMVVMAMVVMAWWDPGNGRAREHATLRSRSLARAPRRRRQLPGAKWGQCEAGLSVRHTGAPK